MRTAEKQPRRTPSPSSSPSSSQPLQMQSQTQQPAEPLLQDLPSDELPEPSAPQLPPPSYDDVLQSAHSEYGGGSGQTDSLTMRGAQGQDSGEMHPLIEQHPGDAGQLSSRDFFSRLEYRRTNKGYSSSDVWLNTDARALRRFIDEGNDKPRVTIEVTGYHMEDKVVESYRTDDQGRQQVHRHTHRENITDFKFSLELTPFIHDRGTLYTARRATDGEAYDIDQVLEDYVAAKGFLKEIRVQKRVIWDYELVRREVCAFIKSTGYPHSVSVGFPMENDKVTVRSHRTAGRVWRHPVTKFLCFVTCACLVGWPVQYLAGRRWRDKVMSDFVVLASPKDFVDRNSTFIRNQVCWSAPRLTQLLGSSGTDMCM
ncbi:hypothetical protein LPJ53_000190 [Coemansia erecta]|uniref:Uncharacterized protein n=1 Tax=Coemansia erecta TaxID=147472 RepID=A0A9W8CVG6_9FUNG|nr:hypothetical protein LPJ53_000190 [Coemansia erecta]